MNKTVKKVWDAVTTVLVALVVVLAVLLVGVRVVGMQVFTVLSGSMEPTYHTGSLIYVKSVDYKTLKVGDPITYMISQDTVVTHRIIEVLVDEEDPSTIRYFTKGDANETEDAAPVHFNNLIGVPVFAIPLLGYVSAYIQSPPGMYVAIGLGIVLLAAVFLPDMLTKKNKKEEEEQQEEAK